MFANASGGILLIGVPEQRDERGQPTGIPDPTAVLGLEINNPEALLASYDARVMEAIEERLSVESASVEMAGGRRICAIRVPNSTRKPHSVRYQGHTYFPSRRERQRYHLSVREMKELVMRTGSRLREATEALRHSFSEVARIDAMPYLVLGIVPVFFDDFLVDVRSESVRRVMEMFNRLREEGDYRIRAAYTFDGLERRVGLFQHTVKFRRNGLLTASQQLPVHRGEYDRVGLSVVDALLRQFVMRAVELYEAANLGAPFLLGMMVGIERPLTGVFGNYIFANETGALAPRDYLFPFVQADDFSDIDRIIRPLCDQAHQMFGMTRSQSFDPDGQWISRE